MSEKTKPPPELPPNMYEKALSRAPGPGKYNLPSDFGPATKGAFRWSMAGKPRARRDEVTPGPDKYSGQRSSLGGIRHSMAARFTTRDREDMQPAAPANDGKTVPPPAVRSSMGVGPKFSMGGRVRTVRGDSTPASTQYDPLSALKFTSTKTPSFSMGAKPRTIARDPYFAPPAEGAKVDTKAVVAPSVKSLIGVGSPKWSMSARLPHGGRKEEVPGAGSYPGANSDLIGRNGPRHTMSARVRGGIQFGRWGDEPRLKELPPPPPVTRLPVVHSK